MTSREESSLFSDNILHFLSPRGQWSGVVFKRSNMMVEGGGGEERRGVSGLFYP